MRLVREELLRLEDLACLLEGAAQEGASLFALLIVARLVEDGLYGLLYPLVCEGDARQVRYYLPNLTVHEVRLPGVDPGLARAVPRPARHPAGVLDVFVFEAGEFHPVAVLRQDLRPYAHRGSHGASLAAAPPLSSPRSGLPRDGRRGGASRARRGLARRPCSPARAGRHRRARGREPHSP